MIGENTALLGYLGELKPAAGLMPAAGTLENYRVREWLGFVSSEMHRNCSPFFRPDTPEATLADAARAAEEASGLSRRLSFPGNPT